MDSSFLNFFIPGGMPNQRSHQRAPQYFDMLYAYSDLQADIRVNLDGNKIILPQSSLYQISGYLQSNNTSPMIFCITNSVSNKQTYVNVLEFTAEEKTCIVPHRIYENLQLDLNPEVHIALTTGIPKAQFVKFQPHETAFIEQSYHPTTLLNVALRNYICLHVGDTITVSDVNNKTFKLNVLEIKPENQYKAGILLDADIDYDLEQPLDYDQMKQLKMKQQSSINFENEEEKQQQTSGQSTFFTGKGIVIDQKQKIEKKKKIVEEKETQQEYDPRKFKLTHGVKQNIMPTQFSGNSQKINQKK